jgi:hypothetical protein
MDASTVAGDGEADASPSMDAMARSATLVHRPPMRRLLAIVGSSLAMACGSLAASATESGPLPAAVQVAANHAYLRAGPGDDFYPTEKLACGSMLEVWAIDPSGYCAVRPVAGGFSWLRAGDVEPDASTGRQDPAAARFTGVVVTDGAVARVGSQLNDLRHVTQVALEAGERVQVLERVSIRAGRHAGEWVRIEPPSGEFRWARCEDLDLPVGLAPLVESPTAEPAGAGLAAAGEAVAAIRDAGLAVKQAVAETPAPPEDAAAPSPSTSTAGKLFAGWLPLGASVFDPVAKALPKAVSGGAVAASGDELADIDLALSLAVSGPKDAWNLAPLRERLRLAQARAGSEAERTRAQAIDARLSRFEAIQGRQQALVASQPADSSTLRIGGMWSSLSALGSRPIRPGVMPGGAPAGGQPAWTPPDQVETTGRLATVISRRPDAPRWALVDDQNNVLTFITPQPGVNLAPLVGQQVSVRGARGYMPEYKRPYLVAAEARTRVAAAPAPAGADRPQ